MLHELANNWWLMLLRGLAAIAFGVIAWVWPGLTLIVMLMVFAGYALVEGVTALVLGFSGKEEHKVWWQMIVIGLVGIAAGLITFLWPGQTAITLLVLIAAWAIIRGMFEIAAAIRLRKEIRGEWLLALNGVIAILFGFLLIMRPGVGILTMVWLVGMIAVASGLLQIVLSLKLRHFKHHPPGGLHHAMGT